MLKLENQSHFTNLPMEFLRLWKRFIVVFYWKEISFGLMKFLLILQNETILSLC